MSHAGVWIWLVVAVVSIIIEIVGSGLIFAGLCGSALAAALVAAIGAPFLIQAIIFALAAVAYVLALRPVVIRLITGHHPTSPGSQTNTQHMIGKSGVVTQQITSGGGQIRVGHGEFWTARPYDESKPIPVGAEVDVVFIDGLSAVVAPTGKTPLADGAPAQSS